MTQPHDFEFQLGQYRALRGRGWKGVAALCLLLTALVLIAIGAIQPGAISNAVRSGVLSLMQKL